MGPRSPGRPACRCIGFHRGRDSMFSSSNAGRIASRPAPNACGSTETLKVCETFRACAVGSAEPGRGPESRACGRVRSAPCRPRPTCRRRRRRRSCSRWRRGCPPGADIFEGNLVLPMEFPAHTPLSLELHLRSAEMDSRSHRLVDVYDGETPPSSVQSIAWNHFPICVRSQPSSASHSPPPSAARPHPARPENLH